MLTLRPEQMDVFRAEAMHAFEHEMVDHLAELSPPLFRTLGEAQMLVAVRSGIAQAEGWGLTLRGPVRLYLELMLLFGSRFDSDPQYAWAGEVLAARQAGSEMARAERLYDYTMDYRRQVAGPDDRYTFTALRNLAALAEGPLPVGGDDPVAAMRREIALAYPQKAAYVGDAGIDALVREGFDEASRRHFKTLRGAVLMSILMFAFGHGCSDDPLYPWIARTLDKHPDADPEATARRLEKKARIWLERVLANDEQEV